MTLDLVTGPAVEPVTLDAMKTWLRIDNPAEDDAIASMISSARRWCEERTNERLITQTWSWTLDMKWKRPGLLAPSYPDDDVPERYADKMIRSGMWIRHQPHFRYPLRPCQAVTGWTYRVAGTDVDFDYSQVRVEKNGLIIFDPEVLPPLSDEQFGAWTVQMRVGFSDDASMIPEGYIQAIQKLCTHWYENRGLYVMPEGLGRILPDEMAAGLSDLLGSRKVMSLG